jgi:hypothetical protein
LSEHLTATTKVSLSAGLQLSVAIAMVAVYLFALGCQRCFAAWKVGAELGRACCSHSSLPLAALLVEVLQGPNVLLHVVSFVDTCSADVLSVAPSIKVLQRCGAPGLPWGRAGICSPYTWQPEAGVKHQHHELHCTRGFTRGAGWCVQRPVPHVVMLARVQP